MTALRQRGVALVLVLWVLVLLTIATGTYALMARMDRLEANALLAGTQARLSAEAGINLVAVALRDDDEETRLIADGRAYQQVLDGVVVEIRVTDERGKLDLNAADEQTLFTLFANHGVDPSEAELLAAAVLDWRDEDELERVNGAEAEAYAAAGLELGPANRNFLMTEELLQVIGVSYPLYQRLEPGISVHSRAALPNLGFAPAEALLAIPDIGLEEALNFVEERHSQDAEGLQGMTLPNGQTIMTRGRGLIYSIQAKATMPNGVWDQIEATIRLGGGNNGRPYRVLRWREGFHH